MNRRGFLKASLVGALASTPFGKALAALPVTAKLVGTATSSSFSIAVSASSLVKAYVEYGYSKGTIAGKSSVYNISKGSTQSISITNLKPNSLVYYKVKYAVGASKNFSALTQRSVKTASVQAISSSTFAIQADPHMDENSSAAVYEGTLKQIVAASPAFLMDLGDI
ncbi:MAG: hypothetical protein EBY13_05500, partial [Actinobacteria bacterium]|nr:hypothetical protein [Actinomycetota bacterium]